MKKCNKSLAEWANAEGLSIREMEHQMDVNMFLDGYVRWEVGSPHCSVILHEMFLYAAEQGQKEAEWMICWSCWHGLLKLDPQVDVSAFWLVGPQTSKEEFRDLYYQVYKLRRLPGSPPWGLEWMEKMVTEIVSSLKEHLGQKEGKPLQGLEESGLADIQPPRSKTLMSGRRGTSTKRDLTEAREVHQRVLATMATLEEKIERLSQSVTQCWPDIHAHSWCWKCQRRRSQGQNQRHMGDLVSKGTWHTWLVARTSQDLWHGWPPGVSPASEGLLQASPVD